jgi:uncharacterized cupredoxin-like copper-binding protein
LLAAPVVAVGPVTPVVAVGPVAPSSAKTALLTATANKAVAKSTSAFFMIKTPCGDISPLFFMKRSTATCRDSSFLKQQRMLWESDNLS